MKIKDLKRQINYIYWKKEATFTKCTFEEFNKIQGRLKLEGTKIDYTSSRDKYKDNYYSVVYKGNNKSIYLCENGNYYVYHTNTIDDEKNKRKDHIGEKGMAILSKRFTEDNGVSFKVAFGYTPEEFKRCIPKIFSYSNPDYYDKPVRTSSADFSSHWPFCAKGRLPMYNKNTLTIQGTVPPTEDHPFAFYLKSGHVAEYGVFDSHDWCKSKLSDAMFRMSSIEKKKKVEWEQHKNLDPNEDVTVLMEASKYELGKYFQDFYDMRKEDEEAKLKANGSIGCMHRRDYTRQKMAHIAAIICGRAQNKTFLKIREVGEMYVVHAVVDGIIYKGSYSIGNDEKAFGELHQEWVGCVTQMHATNCYIVMNNVGECIKVKHGGYQCRNNGEEITEETVKVLNDYENWIAKRGVDD